ncbi:PfkB family carbohydrate kinase [uncultured Finegoldia sp.]|uniref:PfkB family carbohydrate kinase n=1 Tax=uncultured Finegoldia sp. TaxID=328009 RepID=UPI002617B353|nr:PfkB family carbohydrate kinase [uncultured Finegoldia sp.]
MKDILLINDMPGYGRVALSCMIPVLSNKGKSVFNLPTAVVSNTLDYGKFAILDTTEYMKQATKVWEELDFSFDLIATGFLNSLEQVDIIKNFISKQKNNPDIIIDPIMADNGKLYNGLDEKNIENFRKLIDIATVIIPNETEARMISDMINAPIKKVAEKLIQMGAKYVVITSVEEDGEHFVLCMDEKLQFDKIHYEYIDTSYAGTGDLFSALFISQYTENKSIFDCAKYASLKTTQLLKLSLDIDDKARGLPIERFIDIL